MKPYLAYITLSNLYGDDNWQLFRLNIVNTLGLYDSLFKSYGRQMLSPPAPS